jgi:hypothetical protein
MAVARFAVWGALWTLVVWSHGVQAGNCEISGSIAEPTTEQAMEVARNCYSTCPKFEIDEEVSVSAGDNAETVANAAGTTATASHQIQWEYGKNLPDEIRETCGRNALQSRYKNHQGEDDKFGPGCPIGTDSIESFASGMCCSTCTSLCEPPDEDAIGPAGLFWLSVGCTLLVCVGGGVLINMRMEVKGFGDGFMERAKGLVGLGVNLAGNIAMIVSLLHPPDCLEGLQQICNDNVWCCEPIFTYHVKYWLAIAAAVEVIVATLLGLVLIAMKNETNMYIPNALTNNLIGLVAGAPPKKALPGDDKVMFYTKIQMCFQATLMFWKFWYVCYDGWKNVFGSLCSANLLNAANQMRLIVVACVEAAPKLFIYWLGAVIGTIDFWTMCCREDGCAKFINSPTDEFFGKAYRWIYFGVDEGWLAFLCCMNWDDEGKETKFCGAKDSDAAESKDSDAAESSG